MAGKAATPVKAGLVTKGEDWRLHFVESKLQYSNPLTTVKEQKEILKKDIENPSPSQNLMDLNPNQQPCFNLNV